MNPMDSWHSLQNVIDEVRTLPGLLLSVKASTQSFEHLKSGVPVETDLRLISNLFGVPVLIDESLPENVVVLRDSRGNESRIQLADTPNT